MLVNFNPYITTKKYNNQIQFGAKPSDNDKNKDKNNSWRDIFSSNKNTKNNNDLDNFKKLTPEEQELVKQFLLSYHEIKTNLKDYFDFDISQRPTKNRSNDFMNKNTNLSFNDDIDYTGDLDQTPGLLKGQTDPASYRDFHYSDLAGIDNVIKEIRNTVEYPLKYPKFFERFDLKPNRNILLFGAPGCGKTTLARAIANETNSNLFMINGAELQDKYIGETERKLREVFENASKAEPAIIFIDECDSIAPQRSNHESGMHKNDYTNQLLSLIDNLKKDKKNVFVILATNYPELLDKAIVRKGRMDKHIEMGTPDEKGIEAILNIKIGKKPCSATVDKKKIIQKCFELKASGADIEAVVYDACSKALERCIQQNPKLKNKDFSKLELIQEDFDNALANLETSKKSLVSNF